MMRVTVSLDAAWTAAADAVPNGWTGPNFGRNSDGSLWAAAYGKGWRDVCQTTGPTPAAALVALAAKMSALRQTE